jgi:hypothetical protein
MLFVTMKTDTDRSYRTLHHLNPLHRHHRHPHLRLSCPPQVCPRLRRTVTNLQEIIPLRKPRPLRQCPLQHRNSTSIHANPCDTLPHSLSITRSTYASAGTSGAFIPAHHATCTLHAPTSCPHAGLPDASRCARLPTALSSAIAAQL